MTFTAKLVTISPVLFFFLINTLFIGVALLLFVLVRVSLDYQARKSHNDIAAAIFNRAGAIYGIMLAFVVIILWQQYNKAKDNASLEVSQAVDLSRGFSIYPDQQQVREVKKSLERFVRAVVEDEYPAMREMRLSPATEKALNELWFETQKIRPQNPHEALIYQGILKNLEGVSKLRTERLLEMKSDLPGIFWAALIMGAVLSILFAILLGGENAWLHGLLVSMFAAIIATTFFLIIQLDYPFVGELSVKYSPYVKMLETLAK